MTTSRRGLLSTVSAPLFTHFAFCRTEALRSNTTWQRQLIAEAKTNTTNGPLFSLYVTDKRNPHILADEHDGRTRVHWTSLNRVLQLTDAEHLDPEEVLQRSIFVGTDHSQVPHFALSCDHHDHVQGRLATQQPCHDAVSLLPLQGASMSTLVGVPPMDPEDASACGVIHSLFSWSQNLRTVSHDARVAHTNGGWSQHVSIPGADKPITLFPRIDPVVISTIYNPFRDQVLLVRKPVYAKNRFSCVAGFMDVGESIEQAVQREVLEEVGLSVGDVKYRVSQPWPFGPWNKAQIMIGCHATLAEDAPKVTLNDELEDAKWFPRRSIVDILNATVTRQASIREGTDQSRFTAVTTASPGSIAYSLLEDMVPTGGDAAQKQ